MIHPTWPLKGQGLQASATAPSQNLTIFKCFEVNLNFYQLNFYFLFFSIFVETGFPHVAQAGLELLSSGDPLISVSQSAGIADMSHHAQS